MDGGGGALCVFGRFFIRTHRPDAFMATLLI